jgi:hypothetical protein
MRVSIVFVSCAVTLSGLAVAHATPAIQCPTAWPSVAIPVPRPITPTVEATTSFDGYATAEFNATIDITATTDSLPTAIITTTHEQPTAIQPSHSFDTNSASVRSSETPLTSVHWEGALAMALGLDWSSDINIHAAFGLQVDAVRIAAEYTMNKAHSETMDPTSTWRMIDHWGQNQRIGLAGRYRLDTGDSTIGAGLYAEAGAGINLTNWTKQADTRQGDVMFGLGFETLVGEHKRLGMDLGFRFLLSEGVTADAPRELATILTLGMLVGK